MVWRQAVMGSPFRKLIRFFSPLPGPIDIDENERKRDL